MSPTEKKQSNNCLDLHYTTQPCGAGDGGERHPECKKAETERARDLVLSLPPDLRTWPCWVHGFQPLICLQSTEDCAFLRSS